MPKQNTPLRAMKTPRVISYTRFSSHKQAKGLSYARQIEAARDWCSENGYVLDEADQFADLGISAFSGANSETGALAELQEKLRTGEIEPGTILIVEALDRITRQSLSKAVTLLMSLINGGLTVVTLSDRRIWDEQAMSDLGSFMMSVMTLYRGHQESEYKSIRLRKTFKKHRDLGSKQAFGSAPGWLSRVSKDGDWVVDEEKAAVVRRVFELSAAGFGSKAIAARANAEGWMVPTRLGTTGGRWHAQMPGMILRNRAVLGEHQHRLRTHEAHARHWLGFPAGEPVPDYYPRIISDEQWNASRASIRSRDVKKRRDANYFNVFSGLLFCGNCGAPIHRKNESKGRSRALLQCADRISGVSSCTSMSARNADFSILQAIYEFSHESLSTESRKKRSDEIASFEAAIADKLEECERIAEAVSKTRGKVKAFLDKSVRLSEQVDDLQLRLEELHAAEDERSNGPFDDVFLSDVMSYLYVSGDEGAKEQRTMLNLRLSRLVEAIWLFAYDSAYIKFKGGGEVLTVQLPAKKLPSRANPDAKYHRPPKSQPEPSKPIFEANLRGELVLPEPRRRGGLASKTSSLLALDEE